MKRLTQHLCKTLMITSLIIAPVGSVFASLSCGTLGPITPPSGAISATITESSLQTVDPNQSVVPVPHCRIRVDVLTQNPTNASDQSIIKVRMQLPNTYNGKLFMGGGGGFSGNADDTAFTGGLITLAGTPLQRGYTTVTTDTGHQAIPSTVGSWALDVPPAPGLHDQKELNFAYVGVHLATLTAKQVFSAYYGSMPVKSYFNGCSNGGRQGLMEADRYPTDFDGIITGDPVSNFMSILTEAGNSVRANFALLNPITQSQLNLITQKVLAKCDGKDSVLDGIISNPNSCQFNPKQDLPKCPANIPDGLTCFTKDQIAFVDLIYTDVKVTNLAGKKVVIHAPLPGSEAGDPATTQFLLGWSSWITGTPLLGGISLDYLFLNDTLRYFSFDDPTLNLVSYLMSNNNEQLYQKLDETTFLLKPSYDLSNFKARGGKLLMYSGLADPIVAPTEAIQVYSDIKTNTKGNDKEFVRLFLMPAVGHCGYGSGAQVFAGIDVLENWAENDITPEAMVAANLTGTIIRPLCAYPKIAKVINPNGNVLTDPSNWKCKGDDN